MMIQKKYPGLQLITSLETFICYLMYFTIENPDIKLINQLKNDASNNAAFETYQTNITSLINAKADLLQDINTKTRYIDATTGTKYKMYITGGQLAIEDVLE